MLNVFRKWRRSRAARRAAARRVEEDRARQPWAATGRRAMTGHLINTTASAGRPRGLARR